MQISRASLIPESSYISKPAASWLDDFLVWLSPEAFGCCRKFTNGSYCPPDDQVIAFIYDMNIWTTLSYTYLTFDSGTVQPIIFYFSAIYYILGLHDKRS